MHIKIDQGEKGKNTGTVAPLVQYLEKESACFFDQHRSQITREEVIHAIDHNTKKLGRNDEKYFMITISPSASELHYIQNDVEKLMTYARAVMECYAQGFQRGIAAKDLLYFGKIEYTRAFKERDAEVQHGWVPAETPKPGMQTHIHIIVSRKDQSQRLKLSPNTNHKRNRGTFQGGFSSSAFLSSL